MSRTYRQHTVSDEYEVERTARSVIKRLKTMKKWPVAVEDFVYDLCRGKTSSQELDEAAVEAVLLWAERNV